MLVNLTLQNSCYHEAPEKRDEKTFNGFSGVCPKRRRCCYPHQITFRRVSEAVPVCIYMLEKAFQERKKNISIFKHS